MRNSLLLGLLVFASNTFLSGPLTAAVEFDTKIPQLEFAAQELDAALNETGKTNLKVSLNITPDATSPEAFSIKISGAQIDVIGTDATGAMYGGIEVAEYLKLGLPIKNVTRKPFLENAESNSTFLWMHAVPPMMTRVMRHRKTSRTCGISKASGSRTRWPGTLSV